MEASGWAYTEALSELYPTRADVAAEIAELEGRLTLPRSTELFASVAQARCARSSRTFSAAR